MVVAEQVQHAVHDEQRELVVASAGVLGGVAPRATAGQTTMSPTQPAVASTPTTSDHSTPSIGNDSTSVGPSTPMWIAR